METFDIIEINSMSMGFSHAKFGPAKIEKNIYFRFFNNLLYKNDPCHLIKKI